MTVQNKVFLNDLEFQSWNDFANFAAPNGSLATFRQDGLIVDAKPSLAPIFVRIDGKWIQVGLPLVAIEEGHEAVSSGREVSRWKVRRTHGMKAERTFTGSGVNALVLWAADGEAQRGVIDVGLEGIPNFTFQDWRLGAWHTLLLRESASASVTPTWDPSIHWPGGVGPSISTAYTRCLFMPVASNEVYAHAIAP